VLSPSGGRLEEIIKKVESPMIHISSNLASLLLEALFWLEEMKGRNDNGGGGGRQTPAISSLSFEASSYTQTDIQTDRQAAERARRSCYLMY
jgi:hypothetical protein